MSNTLLHIKNLKIEAITKQGWREIVHGVDLELKSGEVLGLIGESGAGKSTIGLAALGYARNGCRLASGQILFKGQDLLTLSERNLRTLRGCQIAYVAQSAAASFNPAHRLIDQYVEVPLNHRLLRRDEAEKQAIELYSRLNLPQPERIGYRYPHQVSGGQLQRAMTAMAMSCRPDLIIFDEPTTALDVTTQLEVLASIREMVRKFNTAAIYITHDLAVVAQMADRIKVLYQGAQVEEQKTADMLAHPQQPYTKSLWSVRDMVRSSPSLPRNETPLLQVDKINAHYGAHQVLDKVSFTLSKGRTVALVGESGSGKSTCARILAGLLMPSSGTIKLNNQILPASYRQRSRDLLRQIQIIYQNADTALNPRQKIIDIVARPLEFYHQITGRERNAEVAKILAMMELEPDHFMHRTPLELSGGQKQRIGIARALAARPQLMICDEVTSALDQLVAEEILQLLQKIQQETQLGLLFITHDLSAVRAIADECCVMYKGEIVEQGATKTIMDTPSQNYTRQLLSCVPQMEADWLDKRLEQLPKTA